MSQQTGFTGGFLIGAFVGGVVGGVLGALLASRRDAQLVTQEETELTGNQTDTNKASERRRQMAAANSESMEMETARRSLEDKIAQLNATIDDVRKQLGNVNGNVPQAMNESSLSSDS